MTQSAVYFLQCSATGLVKIGYSVAPDFRVSALQTGSPGALTLLGVIAGDRQTERVLHERFWQYRRRGEWFFLGRELLDFIATTDRPTTPEQKPESQELKADASGVLSDLISQVRWAVETVGYVRLAALAGVPCTTLRSFAERDWQNKSLEVFGALLAAAQSVAASEDTPSFTDQEALARPLSVSIRSVPVGAGRLDQVPHSILQPVRAASQQGSL